LAIISRRYDDICPFLAAYKPGLQGILHGNMKVIQGRIKDLRKEGAPGTAH
jgi:hypothetical protein